VNGSVGDSFVQPLSFARARVKLIRLTNLLSLLYAQLNVHILDVHTFPVGQPNNPFQDTFATQASATISSSSLQLEGELVEPDLATRGQASTRSSYKEIDEEREMLRIQVMMLQQQLDEVRGIDVSMAPELPPAYERQLEGAHPSTLSANFI
jgi:hypothetical protein